MQQLKLVSKGPKVQYSESEAARQLGLTTEQLRTLVKEHIVKGDEALEGADTFFQQSDLVVLRILANTLIQQAS